MNKKLAVMVMFAFLFVMVPAVSATVVASPGSTSTIMGLPVQQRITGLTPASTYYLDCETSTSSEADQSGLVADSAGVITVTCYPAVYGANLYNLTLTNAAGASQATWTIDNMDIIPYLLPVIIIAVILGFMKSFKRMV